MNLFYGIFYYFFDIFFWRNFWQIFDEIFDKYLTKFLTNIWQNFWLIFSCSAQPILQSPNLNFPNLLMVDMLWYRLGINTQKVNKQIICCIISGFVIGCSMSWTRHIWQNLYNIAWLPYSIGTPHCYFTRLNLWYFS